MKAGRRNGFSPYLDICAVLADGEAFYCGEQVSISSADRGSKQILQQATTPIAQFHKSNQMTGDIFPAAKRRKDAKSEMHARPPFPQSGR